MFIRLLAGLVFSILIGWIAYQRQSLSLSGWVGAVITGTVTFGFGGWVWGLLLIVFFATSSLLSHYKESQKEPVAEVFDKGGQRDLGQALANGGAGALIALLSVLLPGPVWWWAYVGSLATVNADTWATELGVLSPSNPHLVTTGAEVPAGTSGAISAQGILAALAGALTIGIAGLALLAGELGLRGLPVPSAFFPLILVGGLSGLIGSLVDSVLGATVQAIYVCRQCGKETEKRSHHGQPTRPVRGVGWLNNDWVNFISSLAGAVAAVALWGIFG